MVQLAQPVFFLIKNNANNKKQKKVLISKYLRAWAIFPALKLWVKVTQECVKPVTTWRA